MVDTLTMNIKRRYFADIVAGTKRIEYREMKPFWKRRIEPLSTPFKLRLLNGMTRPVPEAVVVVTKVTRHRASGSTGFISGAWSMLSDGTGRSRSRGVDAPQRAGRDLSERAHMDGSEALNGACTQARPPFGFWSSSTGCAQHPEQRRRR
jgi:hypothetical protein